MAQDANTPVSPLTALARRWKLAAALVVGGALAGAGLALATPATYTGEARVAVGSQSLDARIVAGYSVAANQLASDIARYVNDRQAQGDLAPVLGERADEVERVSASPIAGSSVIVVEVDATGADTATQAAQAVAQQLVDQVNSANTGAPDALLQQYRDLTAEVERARQAAAQAEGALAEAQATGAAPAQVEAARLAAQESAAALDVLEVQQQALSSRYRNAVSNTPSASGLSVVREAQVSRDDRSSTLQRNVLAGAGLGGLLALLLATWADRRRARRSADAAGEAPGGATIDVDRDRRHADDVSPTSAR
ncbi:hypothetical protein [Kineococcus sp. SYSU DK004]|uniref:hypothetical protein n=1 Tax=Kineococcus sp. SYSU DK004 TaxID=3383125 RepID=UPI003D7F0D17